MFPKRKNPKRKNLVIVSAGDHSLHPEWLRKGVRNFDLCINYYGDDSRIARRYAESAEYYFEYKGGPYENFALLVSKHDFWRDYDFVQRIDDDIESNAADMSRCFDICQRHDLNLAQPSLEPTNLNWGILAHQQGSHLRYTNFVEIMCPIWKQSVLAEVIFPFLIEHQKLIRLGWGLDLIWPLQLKYKAIAIIDAVTVRHTRPSGRGSLYQGGKDAAVLECRNLVARNDSKCIPFARTIRTIPTQTKTIFKIGLRLETAILFYKDLWALNFGWVRGWTPAPRTSR